MFGRTKRRNRREDLRGAEWARIDEYWAKLTAPVPDGFRLTALPNCYPCCTYCGALVERSLIPDHAATCPSQRRWVDQPRDTPG